MNCDWPLLSFKMDTVCCRLQLRTTKSEMVSNLKSNLFNIGTFRMLKVLDSKLDVGVVKVFKYSMNIHETGT